MIPWSELDGVNDDGCAGRAVTSYTLPRREGGNRELPPNAQIDRKARIA